MCLHTSQFRAKIATEPIICYKLFNKVRGKLYSIYRQTTYPKTGLSVKRFRKDKWGNIEAGLHAYKDRSGAVNYILNWGSPETVIKKMIIPKGTKYYEGTHNLCDSIAALKMKFYKPKTKKK